MPDIRFASFDTTALRLDVYRPAGSVAKHPAMVFFTAPSQRQNPAFIAWARIAASKGLVAVLADLRTNERADDFRALLTHLTVNAASYGLDTSAIAVFGASNNAFNVSTAAQDPRERRIKAAVMYYAGSDVAEFRRDLPVLWIRAGLDRPFVNASIDSALARAFAQNAPVHVINFSGGHHSFETTDDNVLTRDLIDQTVDFVKRVTAPVYRAALQSSVGYATAASHVYQGNFGAAAREYSTLVAQNPDAAQLRHAYGVALLGDRQYGTACSEFEKLKGKGLGPRDLGLPAAQACLHSSGPDAAMAWLKSIPQRFLPIRVKDDPAFVALKDRPDFKALFER